MIKVNTEGKQFYNPNMADDPLKVEKGYAHFNHNGQKDMTLRRMYFPLKSKPSGE